MADLLTLNEAAASLGISPRTLQEHVRQGSISYIATGLGQVRRRKMFDPADLARFKERNRRTECPPSAVPSRARSLAASGVDVVDFKALLEQRRSERRSRSASGKGAAADAVPARRAPARGTPKGGGA